MKPIIETALSGLAGLALGLPQGFRGGAVSPARLPHHYRHSSFGASMSLARRRYGNKNTDSVSRADEAPLSLTIVRYLSEALTRLRAER